MKYPNSTVRGIDVKPINMNIVIKYLFITLLVIQVTSMFVVAKLLGVPSSFVNLMTIFGCILFIVFNRKGSIKAIFHPYSLLLLIVSLVLPVFISIMNLSLFSGTIDYRMVGVRTLLYLIYISSITYYYKYGAQTLSKSLVVSIVIAVCSLILSVIEPGIFYIFAEENAAKSVTAGRAFGFYLQPNIAAASLNAMFLSLVCIKRQKPSVIISAICLLGIILTASRAGIFLFVVIYTLIFLYSTGNNFIANTIIKMPKLILFGLFASLSLVSVITMYESLEISNNRDFSASKRLSAILDVVDDSNTSITKDSDHRVDLALSYIDYIKNRPIGYGLGVVQRMKASGRFVNSPHNQYVQVAFETGLLGLGFYLALVILLLLKKTKKIPFIMSICIALFLILYGFVSNTILNNRSIYLLIAIYTASSTVFSSVDPQLRAFFKNWSKEVS